MPQLSSSIFLILFPIIGLSLNQTNHAAVFFVSVRKLQADSSEQTAHGYNLFSLNKRLSCFQNVYIYINMQPEVLACMWVSVDETFQQSQLISQMASVHVDWKPTLVHIKHNFSF